MFSCRLTWEYSIRSWLGIVRTSWNDRLVLHRHSPDWLGLSHLAEVFSSHSPGSATIDSWVSPLLESLALVSLSVNLHLKSLLASLWHGALLSGRIRKTIAAMAAREHWEIHNVEQTEKMIPLITFETSFGQHVSELFFGVNIFDLDFWLPMDSVYKQEQLCEFWTRVSLLDFVFWSSSWWQLRHLQRCTTQTRFEKNVCLWVRRPHLTIDQRLACSFQLVFRSWFCCSNGLLSRTSFLELIKLIFKCCSLNLTLQLRRPRGRQQVIHPLAVQHPKKWFQILWNYMMLTSVSCPFNWWAFKDT